MSGPPYAVLFLCTGNSARSILAEAIVSRIDPSRFRGHSAGSRPAGRVNPFALALLAEEGYPTAGLRSKSWEEFAAHGAPALDFIFTVCDSAAAEACPVWPGRPVSAHWGVPDPAAVEGTDADRRRAFRETFVTLQRRIALFASLPLEELDASELRARLREIGAR